MLNKKQVYNLLRERVWILQYFNKDMAHPGLINLLPKPAFLCFTFKKNGRNGRIDVPNGVGFIPDEYNGWDFDEASQEIIFTEQNGKPRIRTSLPKQLPYGIEILKQTGALPGDGNTIYFFANYPHLNSTYAAEQFLGGTKAFFLPRSSYTKDFYDTLRWTGFNTNLVDHEDNRVAMLTEIYDYLAYHPQIKQVIFAQANIPVVQLPKKQHLLFTLADGQPSLDYFSGTRAAIMELLSLIISENNLRLYNDADQRDETAMLQDIIANLFAGRYEVIDSLPEATSLWQILLEI
ncbi:hypothetical protein [Pediococcus acidilactici]|uniref:hypothetical protein n=1 Tax=Pediococcus acidilactici TaxID=1254 RepID=UPI00132C9926|nr:hypothetical protein [Pediococcus acidilactici]KAF0336630.1 hypothetical protein GBO20_01590 [Pediococcus acidilactici]KAF0337338.1 hypothetical protein GBO39_06110 [Pediococcus acidilactici]KAF0340079.1 hypothetical protein GBO40_03785 [Pediococcus acidilactici]KAF0345507.1 hypothetical protein GBO43_04140 [Pediococcus acidilactici]KAF0349215.1 hypothetical protein GBO45_05330 [Pediococcus acidilactici]